MFSVGDKIIYGSMGVCTVVDRRMPDMPGATQECYVLEPQYVHNARVYVPVAGTAINMRPLLSAVQAKALVNEMPRLVSFAPSKEKQVHQEIYRTAVRGADSHMLARLIKTLYERKQSNLEQKKNLPMLEKEHYDTARMILFGEIATALDTTISDVEAQVTARMEKHNNSAATETAAEAT